MLIPLDNSGSLLEEAEATIEIVFFSVSGLFTGTGFLDDVGIGGFFLTDQLTVVQDGASDQGLLGNLVLRQFDVIFDGSRNVTALKLNGVIPATI